jgi:predicted nucleotidyltransferase
MVEKMININSYLRNLASELFISNGSTERSKIDTSIIEIKRRLKLYFSDEIDSVDVFGSYKRGTILPRKYDERSDVDLIIQFNTEKHSEYTAETYREKLIKFVNHWYGSSEVYKDFPTIVLELSNIKFDLVPAIMQVNLFLGSGTLFIPDSYNNWQSTEPYAFSQNLIQANSTYNNIVKPIVRLLKYWNASSGYPFASFKLEQLIADMNFYNDNYERGFFYAIEMLPERNNKVTSLKSNAEKVQDHLENEEEEKAMKRLDRILPD